MNDYTLGNDIKRRMEAEGVPVVRDLPPGAGFLYRMQTRLLENDMPCDDFNVAWGKLVEKKKNHCSHDEIEKRLQELINEWTKQ